MQFGCIQPNYKIQIICQNRINAMLCMLEKFLNNDAQTNDFLQLLNKFCKLINLENHFHKLPSKENLHYNRQ